MYTAVNSKSTLTNHALKGNCHKIFVNHFPRNLDYPISAIKLILKLKLTTGANGNRGISNGQNT